jgi:hypothetical protein
MAKLDLIDVTLTADTNIFADNDVIAATQEVEHAFRAKNQTRMLRTITLLDEDDQAQDIDLIFLNANSSVGAENAAFSLTDAAARTVIGYVSVVIADYIDTGGSVLAYKTGLALPMKSAADSTSLYVAAVARSGTPTYTASGLKLRLGLE